MTSTRRPTTTNFKVTPEARIKDSDPVHTGDCVECGHLILIGEGWTEYKDVWTVGVQTPRHHHNACKPPVNSTLADHLTPR